LREAAALGDMDGIKMIIRSGNVNINHQHRMNGWTALHWAAKRNRSLVVALLQVSGADDNLADFSGKLAGDVTDDPDIRKMLKVSSTQDEQHHHHNGGGSSLPIQPNYLRHPIVRPEEYYSQPEDSLAGAGGRQSLDRAAESRHRQSREGRLQVQDVSTSPAQSGTSPAALHNMHSSGSAVGAHAHHNPMHNSHPSPNKRANAADAAGGGAQSVLPPPPPANSVRLPPEAAAALAAANSQQRSDRDSRSNTPLTRILKLRLEGEKDFVEADLRWENLHMSALLSLVSSELDVNQSFIKYLRKLPNTRLRRDIDVMRLTDYQEIEVVLIN